MRKLYWALAAFELASCVAAVRILHPGFYNVMVRRVELFDVAPNVHLAAILLPAIAFLAALLAAKRSPSADRSRAVALSWLPLLACAAVPLRAVLGWKPCFLEPLLLVFPVALAVMLAGLLPRRREGDLSEPSLSEPAPTPSRLPIVCLIAATLAVAAYLFLMQESFLRRLAFGWTDVGLNYLRVKNTALGRGFLQETLERPTFYDHFNVGLSVLVPLWWAYSKLQLIEWAQAAFLAALAPAVYVYARGRGLGQWTALLLALAAVLHPSISQIAYSYSYGFHPGTLALPAVVLSIHFWEKRRWWAFAAFAVFASSMEETLFPLYFGIGLVEALSPRGARKAGAALAVSAAALFLLVTKVVMPAFTGPQSYFQLVKFAHLGSSVTEIALSPLTRPAVFWGTLFSSSSLSLLAIVLAAMAFLPLLAPRQFLYPLPVVVFALLVSDPDYKSLAFWYQGLFLVTWFTAAVAGAERLGRMLKGARARAFALAAPVALVAAIGASHFYGAPAVLPPDHALPEALARPSFSKAPTRFAISR